MLSLSKELLRINIFLNVYIEKPSSFDGFLYINHMKKVYVLIGSRGSWDAYEKFIIGVFDTYEMANAEMQNTISELENKPQDYTSKSINIKDIQIKEYPINHKILSLINYEKTN